MSWWCSFVGPALAWLNGPVVGALGCCVCASRLKTHYRKSRALSTFRWGSFSPKTWASSPPQRKLIVDVFFPKRVWYSKTFRHLNVYSFFLIIIYNALLPLKISNRTLGKIPFLPEQHPHCSSFSVNFCRGWWFCSQIRQWKTVCQMFHLVS